MTVTATAPAPSRATTSITIAWGLISLPVSVFTGTEETRVARKEFIKIGDALVPVGRAAIRKDTGEVIDNADVVRMAQASSGEFVVLTDDEIASCTSPRGQAEIVSFVPIKNVAANYLAENQAQVRPQTVKGKSNPATDKAFTLLLQAMSKRKVVALIKVAMRGPARFALLDSTGTLTMIRTADQVREARPMPDSNIAKAELDMALMLIDSVGVDTPVLTDDTAPVVAKFVESKATGKAPVVVQAQPEVGGTIMDQLMASITATKGSKSVAS